MLRKETYCLMHFLLFFFSVCLCYVNGGYIWSFVLIVWVCAQRKKFTKNSDSTSNILVSFCFSWHGLLRAKQKGKKTWERNKILHNSTSKHQRTICFTACLIIFSLFPFFSFRSSSFTSFALVSTYHVDVFFLFFEANIILL